MTTMPLARLIPMLPVRNMAASVNFYCDLLGFEVESRNDQWGWAMLRSGECRLMVDQSINVDPDAPRQGILYLYPEHIETYHAQLQSRGLAVPPLERTFYGMLEFRIEDPDGNRLWVGEAK